MKRSKSTNNKIIVETKTKKGKDTYNIILKIEDNENEYVIYTKNEKNKCGDLVAYAAECKTVDGKQCLEPVEREDILEYLDSILLHIESSVSKKESGK